MKVGVIDIRISNIRSICNLLEFSDIKYTIIGKDNKLDICDKYILPGVGTYDVAVELLRASCIDVFLKDEIKVGKSLLGICLGMQLLSTNSDEGMKGAKGLNLIPGVVEKLPNSVRIPHVGWNEIRFRKDTNLLMNIPNGEDFYFVHSYHYKPTNKNSINALTHYGEDFVSVISHENIYGVQFHPEKSQRYGIQLLRNFSEKC